MYEYQIKHWGPRHTESLVSGPDGLQALLNHEGAEGWELVSALPGGTDTGMGEGTVLFFKRPVAEKRSGRAYGF